MAPTAVDYEAALEAAAPDCAVPECGMVACRRGWCHKHYSRWRRHGDPYLVTTAAKTKGITREFKQQWVINYKLDHGCADCGYAEHPSALDFDHRPGTEKVRDIKSGQHLGWEALLTEVAKCDVVCANCHRIRTFNRRRSLKKVRLISRREVMT